MKNNRNRYIALFAILLSFESYSQDMQFSQREYANQQMNPASIGTNGRLSFTSGFRTQWRGIGENKGFQSTYFSGDGIVSKDRITGKGNLAIGAFFLNDRSAKYLSNNYGAITVAYHLKISREQSFGIGIYTGLGSLALDQNRGTWSNQYSEGDFDQSISSGENIASNSFSYLDAGTGAFYQYKKKATHYSGIQKGFKIGASAFHLNKPSYSFIQSGKSDRLNIRISGLVGADFPLQSTKIVISPAFYLNVQQTNKELLLGSNFTYALGRVNSPMNLSLGFYSRLKDAFIVQSSIQMGGLSIGLSYDISISDVSNFGGSKGAYEVFLRFKKMNNNGINTTRI
jgi:type IX secretion system PorP/SprF family membrane protein